MAEYYYQFSVDYRGKDCTHDSGYLGSEDTREKAHESLIKGIEYYVGIECEIKSAEIHAYCRTCNGTGEKFIPAKRGNRVMMFGKHVKCPDCKGKDSGILIEKVV